MGSSLLPPQDLSGDSTQEYFVLGLYDGLVAELQQIGTLGVISRTSSMAYRGTTKPVPQIARELGVDGIVETSVLRQGDSVHLRVQLIRAKPSERALWGHKYDAEVGGVLKLYGKVAKDIARETGAGLTTEEETRFATRREVNPQTYEAYVKGMYYIGKGTPEGAARGIGFLKEAIDRDPADPLAWAGLSLTYLYAAHGPDPQVDALPLAKAAAERAARLDPTLTETMSALAFLKGYYDWDWAAADSMFRSIVTLNPSAAVAHYWYSWQLVLFDQMDSAIAEHKRAQLADPLNPLHTAWFGELYVMDGRPDEGLVEVRRALALDSMFAESYAVMTDAFVAKGQLDSALAAAEHAWRVDHSWWYLVARIQVLMGRRDEARRVAAEYEAKPPTPWNAFGLAVVYANLGENDAAFRWLNYEHPHGWVPWVRVVSWLAPLRDDPRLPAFLEKMHVPPLRRT